MQFAAAAAARQRTGYVRAWTRCCLTAHARVTFLPLLNKGPPAPCSWKGPFSPKDTGKTSRNVFPLRKGPFAWLELPDPGQCFQAWRPARGLTLSLGAVPLREGAVGAWLSCIFRAWFFRNVSACTVLGLTVSRWSA